MGKVKMSDIRSQIAINFSRNVLGYTCDAKGNLPKGSLPPNVNLFLNNLGLLMDEVESYCKNKKLLFITGYCPAREMYFASLAKDGRLYKKFYHQQQAVCIMQAMLEANRHNR